MKLKIGITAMIALFAITCSGLNSEKIKKVCDYKVIKLEKPLTIDANWEKAVWQKAEAVELRYFMGIIPKFRPVVKAKIMYDLNNLYVIFRVEDRYVRTMTFEYNGPVWDDSCVEFFFSPDSNSPEKYFNLEINCGGTPLMHYNIIPRKDFKILEISDIEQIEISHSLPKIIETEISNPVTWTLEYRIPFNLLKKYANVSQPGSGVVWRANFYKIADKTSNPHYMTWTFVNKSEPDFHLPAYFGNLIFQ